MSLPNGLDSDLSEPESPTKPINQSTNHITNPSINLLSSNNLSSSQSITQSINDKPNFLRARTSTVGMHRQSITHGGQPINQSIKGRAGPSPSMSGTYIPLFSSSNNQPTNQPNKKRGTVPVNQPINQSINQSFNSGKKNQLAARLNGLVHDIHAHDNDVAKAHQSTNDIHEPLLQALSNQSTNETISQSTNQPTNQSNAKVYPASPSSNKQVNDFDDHLFAGKPINKSMNRSFYQSTNQPNDFFAADLGDWKPYDAKANAKLMAQPNNHPINQSNNQSNDQPLIETFDDSPPSCLQRTKQSLNRVMHRPVYQYGSIGLTLFSLYLHDFGISQSINQSTNLAISIILLIIMVMFLVEILINCFLKKKYFLSFFFFLDVIGTLSIILDVNFIMAAIIDQSINQSIGSNDRIQHTASVVRLTRFARILRVLRLIRIVRLFRYHISYDTAIDDSNTSSINPSANQTKHASKVGMQLTELIDKRVILMVLAIILITPFLIADPVSDQSLNQSLNQSTDQSISFGLELMIDSVMIDSMIDCAVVFINTHPTLYYLTINTPTTRSFYQAISQTTNQPIDQSLIQSNGFLTFLDLRSDYENLRPEERDKYEINQIIQSTYQSTTSWTNQSTIQATMMFSTRQTMVDYAVSSLLTTTLVIVVFMIGSVIISRQIDRLIVQPIDRMTNILRKLAGTVCFLTNLSPPPNDKNDGSGENEQLETTLIENTINQIATIFSVEPDSSINQPKPLQMLAGSKHTEIITQSSVVEIQVIERPKLVTEQTIIDDGTITDDRSTWKPIDLSDPKFSEFSSIEALLGNPSMTPYLYAYLSDCFVSENLLFTQQVDRFRSIMIQHAVNLYNSFISSRAPTQINIPHSMKQAIINQLSNPSIDIFYDAQKECMQLMENHWPYFLQSKYGRRAMSDLAEQEKRRARLRPKMKQQVHSTINQSINQSTERRSSVATSSRRQSVDKPHTQVSNQSGNLLEVPHKTTNQPKSLSDHELKPSSDEEDMQRRNSSNQSTKQSIKQSMLATRSSRSVSSLPSVHEMDDEGTEVKPLTQSINQPINQSINQSAQRAEEEEQIKKPHLSAHSSFNQSRARDSSEGPFPGSVNDD